MDLLVPFLKQGFRWMIQNNLRGVYLRGTLPKGPCIWAANHHSWWDGFIAEVLLWDLGQTTNILIEQESLVRFNFLRRLGALGTHELRSAIKCLKAGNILIIYPEGVLRAPGPLGTLAPGTTWLAVKTGTPIIPVAVRVSLRGHQASEAYLDVGKPLIETDPKLLTDQLTHQLSSQLEQLDNALIKHDPLLPLPEFKQVLKGKMNWEERFEHFSKWHK